MSNKNVLILAGVAAAGAVGYLLWRQIQTRTAGVDVRNDAAGPRLPALPSLPALPALPSISGAAPNMPQMPRMPAMPAMPSMPSGWLQ